MNRRRLLTKQYPAATSENITYTWDSTAGGNKGIGRLTKIQDASGSIEWTYNALAQVTQEKKMSSSVVYTVGYAYDLDGNITQITYPSGRTVSYSRGSTGLVTGVTTKKDSGSSSVTLASGVTYLPFGGLNSLTYGNGLTLNKTFTQDYLIDTLRVQDPSNLTLIVDRSHAFRDGINLTSVTDGSSQPAASGSPVTNTNNYPGGNNLLSTLTQGATTVRAFAYDGAGNATADTRGSTAYNYRYNKRGRLDRLTIGSTVTADYIYDGLERLAIRTTQNMSPAGTTHYLYDLSGWLIAEADNTGQTLREYVWLDELPLAVVSEVNTGSPNLYFVHADHINRPIRMTNGAKAVVWDAFYKPFGEVIAITGSASNNLRFPGQYFLIESGLHYNWHRHYDPTLGRYVQADPLGLFNTLSADPTDGSIGMGDVFPVRSSFIHGETALDGLQLSAVPKFSDGSRLYTYAKSSPAANTDVKGLSSASFTSIAPSLNGENACQVAMGDTSYCKVVRNACIAQCSLTSLPSGNFGWRFFSCVNACMKRHGCDPFAAG